MKITQRGFTLVELSIVLVILGLLIGGVLTGQSLIRAAELRSVTTQYQRYLTATQTFRDKYFALPGDMSNATAYWGAADNSTGTTNACKTAVGTGTATCNGDADGKVTTSNAPGSIEVFRFWQHLANAGLIEGSYSGVPASTGSNSATTANSPAGRISSSIWYAQNWGASSGSYLMFDGQYDNTFLVGAPVSNNYPYNPIMKPEDAYNIDTKLDDGKPATGKVVISVPGTYGSCTDTTIGPTDMAANYALTKTVIACGLIFRQIF